MYRILRRLSIQTATAISPTALDVLYNEPVEIASSQLITNYSVNNNLGIPVTAAFLM